MKYRVWREGATDERAVVIGPDNEQYKKGITVSKWALNSCGIGSIQGFYQLPCFTDSYVNRAEFLSVLYRELYNPGYAIYCLSDTQLFDNRHKALLEIGCRELASWPNLYHSPNKIHLFLVNVREGVGKFFNEYGEPFEKAPDVVVPSPNANVVINYGELPKRPLNANPTIAQAVPKPHGQPAEW